jgi:hypothetical protein
MLVSRVRALLPFTASVLFFACGCGTSTSPAGSAGTGEAGTSGQGGGGVTAFENACAGVVAYEMDCWSQQVSYEGCLAAEPCFNSIYRDDAEAALLACLADHPYPCGQSCARNVAKTLDFTPASAAHSQHCTQFKVDCPNINVKDICRDLDVPDPYWKVFDDALFKAIEPCFAQPCDAVFDCINQKGSSFFTCGGNLTGLDG